MKRLALFNENFISEEFNEESDENEKYKDVSHEISVVQSTTAVAVLDNSENINGRFTL